jgi:hypothetical protein
VRLGRHGHRGRREPDRLRGRRRPGPGGPRPRPGGQGGGRPGGAHAWRDQAAHPHDPGGVRPDGRPEPARGAAGRPVGRGGAEAAQPVRRPIGRLVSAAELRLVDDGRLVAGPGAAPRRRGRPDRQDLS